MKTFLGKIFFALTNWKITGIVPTEKKYIVLQAPHTSNWDFLVGKMFNFIVKMDPKIFIKKELFVFPIGIVTRFMGGIPVDRSRKTSLIEDTIAEFNKHENFILAITPEGSRSRRVEWKKGFHHIAKKAGVPVYLGYIDYKTKEVGVEAEPLTLTDNVDTDMAELKRRYSKYTAKYPENFGY